MRGRPGRVTAAFMAAVATATFVVPAAQAQAGSSGLADPPANVPRTAAMAEACSISSQDCQVAVVEAIDQARASEGVGPLQLPAYYDDLSLSEQLLVLANLERVNRGLPGFSGLSAQLDQLALQGASANADPEGPSGVDWGSNWAGGEASALLADYDWMYDDGHGSPNMDCTAALAGGCWDHRNNVLGNYGPHPSMGAAATKVNGVTSMTELFSSGSPGRLDFGLPKGQPDLVSSESLQTAVGHGYWEATARGQVLAYAGGGFRGSAARIRLARPVVGLAATPDGDGYWEVASDGGVYSFGSARFYGTPLGHAGDHVVGIAATPDGKGYWLVTKTGRVYSFGDAKYYGPHEPLHLAQPVVGMAVDPNGGGYWLVTKSGTVYSFGDARYFGSPAKSVADVVGMAAPATGTGYYVATAHGQVYSFGVAATARAQALGTTRAAVVAMAAA